MAGRAFETGGRYNSPERALRTRGELRFRSFSIQVKSYNLIKSSDLTSDSIEHFLHSRCGSNSKRFHFLSRLETWANAQQPSTLQPYVADFVQDQTLWSLQHLHTPLEGEKELLTEKAISYGGVLFVEKTFVSSFGTSAISQLLQDTASTQDGQILRGVCPIFTR